MFKKAVIRGLIPALAVSGVLAAAAFAPSVGASVHRFLTSAYPCTAVSLVAAPASPKPSGTSVTLTAAGTCPNASPKFEFWMRATAQPAWQLLQAYSVTNTYVWNSTGAVAGDQFFSVWALDSSSSAQFDVHQTITYTTTTPSCGSTTLVAAPASPQASGTSVTLTAGATCTNASPKFEFWMRATAQPAWQLLKAFSTTTTYVWNSTGAVAGSQFFSVWSLDASSGAQFDDHATITFATTTPTCTTVSITPASGAIVRPAHDIMTAANTGACTNSPRYEFWMLPAGGTTWLMVQGYSATATYDWNSAGAAAGTVKFSVWIRDSASSAAYDGFAPGTPVTVT